MKQTTYILTLIIGLIGFTLNVIGQTEDKYKVLLNRVNTEKFEVYDTIVSFEFLTYLKSENLTNIQILEGFNYPKFKIKTTNETTVLSNDSIKIILKTIPFDSVAFKLNYKKDSGIYYKSLYFREFPMDFDYPIFYPKSEISEIKISVNDRKIKIPASNCKDLYNPDLKNHRLDNIELFGLNGYVTDNGEILLTLFCGEGAGAYKVIFLFDRSGRLIKRINEPVV